MKIVRDTETMSVQCRQEAADRLRALIAINREHHPVVTLKTGVEEVEHPITGRPVIAISQERVYGPDVLTLPIKSPAVRSQLALFAEQSLDIMVPNGFAPDVVGAGNILLQGDEIKLVDTVALENLHKPNTAFPLSVQILRQLANPKA